MDAEIVSEFLSESRELLERVDRDLVALEREPHSQALVASIFRAMHTMKGSAVCLGFSRYAWIAHNGESVLGHLRDGELAMDPAVAGALLEMVDVLRVLLDRIETDGGEGPDEPSRVVARLEGFARGKGGSAVPRAVADPAPRPARATLTAVAAVPRADATLRVDKRVIDGAVSIAADLAEAVRALDAHAPALRAGELSEVIARLERLSSGLYEMLRRTRMQPIGNLWISLPRVARDLAMSCGKRVRLETEGAQIDVDRALLDAVKDPIAHLLRNAVDHGIEPPPARVAAGKEPVGTITLSAAREGGDLVIAIADDGGGVDLSRVRARAVERGVLKPAQAERASDVELLQLLFVAGFSTAARVTQVSGRGVGLDVVRNNVEAAGGEVEIVTRLRVGTMVRLRFPLAAARAESAAAARR